MCSRRDIHLFMRIPPEYFMFLIKACANVFFLLLLFL